MTKASSPSSKPKAVKVSKTQGKTPKASHKTTSAATGNGSKKDQIFRHLCEQYAMGIQEVSKLDAALAVNFKNPRSEGFSKPLKELTSEDGLVTNGSKKDWIALTEKGIAAIPSDMEMTSDPSKIHDRYIEFLEKKVKMGAEKVRPLWGILMDGKPHAINDIAKEFGYKNPRSFGNTKIVQAMKDMGLVEDAGKGAITFTDKVPGVAIVSV